MTTTDYLRRQVIPAASALLPSELASPRATAMLVAIALQESGCTARRQMHGPARGFWQFEIGGVRAVMAHPACTDLLKAVCATLAYPFDATTLYIAIEHHDVLACVCARLLLWSSPEALPSPTNAQDGWQLYASTWRPGAPRPDAWPAHFAAAWDVVSV